MGSVGPSFSAFVREVRPALLPVALLLTGDRANAEDLVQRTLTRASRIRGGLPAGSDARDVALTLLVAESAGRRTGRSRTQVLESLPDPWAPVRPDEGAEVARVLRELPPRTRAAVVLRSHLGRSPADTARLLGCTVDTATAEGDRGLAELRGALAPGGYERPGTAVDDDQRVRDRLVRLAAAPGRWVLDTEGAVADVRDRRRSARLRTAGAAAALLCAAGLVVPIARSARPSPPAEPPAAAAATTAGAPVPVVLEPVPILVGPTRGSLAGDRAFLEAVRRLDWGSQTAPPVELREVVLAEDTPAGRVVLVVGTLYDDFRGVWLTGPVGAPPEALAEHAPVRLGPARPLSLMVGGPDAAALVVVAGREDRIEVSDRLRIGPLGTVGRRYEEVASDEGVAIVPAPNPDAGASASVRIVRDGRVVHRGPVDRLDDGPGPGDVPSLRPLRPAAVPPDPHLVSAALRELADPLGATPAQLEPELLWTGRLPESRRPGTAAILLGRSPGGGRIVTTWAGSTGAATACGVSTPPGNTDVLGLTVARTCVIPGSGADPSAPLSWLIVSAPPEAATADVLDSSDRVVGSLRLTDGGAVVQSPDGATTLRTRDATGATMTEVPVAPMATERFGNYGRGAER